MQRTQGYQDPHSTMSNPAQMTIGQLDEAFSIIDAQLRVALGGHEALKLYDAFKLASLMGKDYQNLSEIDNAFGVLYAADGIQNLNERKRNLIFHLLHLYQHIVIYKYKLKEIVSLPFTDVSAQVGDLQVDSYMTRHNLSSNPLSNKSDGIASLKIGLEKEWASLIARTQLDLSELLQQNQTTLDSYYNKLKKLSEELDEEVNKVEDLKSEFERHQSDFDFKQVNELNASIQQKQKNIQDKIEEFKDLTLFSVPDPVTLNRSLILSMQAGQKLTRHQAALESEKRNLQRENITKKAKLEEIERTNASNQQTLAQIRDKSDAGLMQLAMNVRTALSGLPQILLEQTSIGNSDWTEAARIVNAQHRNIDQRYQDFQKIANSHSDTGSQSINTIIKHNERSIEEIDKHLGEVDAFINVSLSELDQANVSLTKKAQQLVGQQLADRDLYARQFEQKLGTTMERFNKIQFPEIPHLPTEKNDIHKKVETSFFMSHLGKIVGVVGGLVMGAVAGALVGALLAPLTFGASILVFASIGAAVGAGSLAVTGFAIGGAMDEYVALKDVQQKDKKKKGRVEAQAKTNDILPPETRISSPRSMRRADQNRIAERYSSSDTMNVPSSQVGKNKLSYSPTLFSIDSPFGGGMEYGQDLDKLFEEFVIDLTVASMQKVFNGMDKTVIKKIPQYDTAINILGQYLVKHHTLVKEQANILMQRKYQGVFFNNDISDFNGATVKELREFLREPKMANKLSYNKTY